ncbi:rod shape-determining protein MreC [Pelagicoccus sp. NFK12]|uniref:Cell shape-determining protein MreC n=1 Tax=Pelagicoccus enzymogenes TaxID=2773457 RepID=A0A927FEM4_9BACT|nr:rod shape-determining protein MreC [Pelagicoccus enzymogenes]MBD5782285.1 rod shape-determining protein MreC [Pelagicoccus enzymogenes]MDQ8197820.1 rod shape-determining protein MreC [Pelagicoccus enzymogenes]
MYRKRLGQFKPLIVLGVATMAWLTLPVVFKSFAKTSFYEFQAPVSLTSSYVRDLQDFWAARTKSKNELYEAGQGLARLNAAYELTALENNTLKDEIARLEDLLQLPSRPDYQYEIARVVERDFNAWWQRIIIRKGRDYGIPVGAPVVFVGGVVGRVSEVHAYTSTVDIISNNHLRLAVVIEGDNRPLSYRGGGAETFATPVGIAEFIPVDIQIADTENLPTLVTSGMGGVYPAGIRVGEIRRLKQGAGGMFYDGEVVLDERLASLTEVAVMIQIPPEQ